MHRSTTLQRLYASILPVAILSFIFNDKNVLKNFNLSFVADNKLYIYFYKDYNILYAIISLSIFIFIILNVIPNAKIFFNASKGVLTYYRFLLFKKEISFSDIIKIEGQTKTERKYQKGKSTTVYKNDVFILTEGGDYQVNLWERAKIGEFKSKFSLANQQFKDK